MPASIVLGDLAWAPPGGPPLFSDLNLAFGPERAGIVGRNGVGKTTLLRLIAGELSPTRGTVTVKATLGVLRQTVQATADQTVADLFGVTAALAILTRAADGAATEDDLALADWTLESRIEAALAQVSLSVEPAARLAGLSGGQRTRAGLAALVFARPDFLLLDEPTNHLDREGREVVRRLLDGWGGGALVVSHDRELLDGMDAIVELTPLGVTRFGGGWSAYRARKDLDLAAAEHDLADARKTAAAAAREAQSQAERQAGRDAGGKRKAAKGDMPKILLGKRKARAEETAGGLAKAADARIAQARETAAAAQARLEVIAPLTVDLPSTRLVAGKTVLRLDDVTAGYRGTAVLRGLSLDIAGPERIAVTGPNGSGKSTLLAVITGTLAPISGTVAVGVPFVLLDQEAGLLDPACSILENFRRLNPAAEENACRAALARFRFRADAALAIVGTLSGGQRIRAALACVLGGPAPPPLLILDEPTNHLDLDAVQAVETGLAGYDGALIVVSHDEAFLAALGVTRRLLL